MVTSRRLGSAAAAALLVCGTMIAGSGTASAESSTQPTSQYPWPHNGCTSVPDDPAGVSFTYACNHHDGCYAWRWADKNTCDAWFRNDMVDACNQHASFWNYSRCLDVATLYWVGVQLRGQKYYDSEGQLVRIDTPVTTG